MASKAWSGKKSAGRFASKLVSCPSAKTLAKVEAIKKSNEHWLQAADSSSEDSEDESSQVLSNTLSKYLQQFGEAGDEQHLAASLISAPGSCLVCLSAIKRAAAVWSCLQCHCTYHLVCVQQWVRDGITEQGTLSVGLFPLKQQSWSCPKCRREYPQSMCPVEYRCFCGKLKDPPVDPWLLPHSCGEICDRPLQPNCGHRCVSLCHPGSCPPCPKTTSVACFCGRSKPLVKRCGAAGWSCGRVCRKELLCGLHICEQPCHGGSCAPCSEVTEQPCECGKETQRRSCAEGGWHCQQPCGKLLECGHHDCEQLCHAEVCSQCPRTGERTCPCGKTKHLLPCTEEVPTCGDTCGKALECGQHECVRQCHRGDCGPCRQVAVKQCRCGRKEKAMVCSQEFLCEMRCQKLRQCTKHQCRRKCCNGECPACEQSCSRALACRNHKCPAPCHTGRCYPCVLMVEVTCKCGAAKVRVPCGTERNAKPPRCRKLCLAAPICHHTKRKPHSCHFGGCPPCKLVCGKVLACGHSCSVSCHSEPQVQKPTQPSLGFPSRVQPPVLIQPCPPCTETVAKSCRGGHEVSNLRCCELREYSCGRKCGRSLPCGNHACQRGCHVIINVLDSSLAGDDCLPCERGCERKKVCTHSCPLPCHSDPCPTCEVLTKLQCHCGTMALFVRCSEWSNDQDKRTQLQTCNSQCIRLLECGHRCHKQCHPAPCPSSQQCRRKVTVRCPCKRLKKEFRCNERLCVDCDSECGRLLREREDKAMMAAQEQLHAEEREKASRMEALERQLRPRRRKPRNRPTTPDQTQLSFLQQYRVVIFVLAGALLAAVCAAVLYMK